MALSRSDLDQLAEDTYHDRRVTGMVFCGRCGYNLHTLPYVYRCPECGNPYNARPLKMQGIFFPHAVYPPFVEMFAAVFFGVIAFFLLIAALKPVDEMRLILGAILAVLTGVFAGRALQQFQRFLQFRSLAKRIEKEEEAQ